TRLITVRRRPYDFQLHVEVACGLAWQPPTLEAQSAAVRRIGRNLHCHDAAWRRDVDLATQRDLPGRHRQDHGQIPPLDLIQAMRVDDDLEIEISALSVTPDIPLPGQANLLASPDARRNAYAQGAFAQCHAPAGVDFRLA